MKNKIIEEMLEMDMLERKFIRGSGDMDKAFISCYVVRIPGGFLISIDADEDPIFVSVVQIIQSNF